MSDVNPSNAAIDPSEPVLLGEGVELPPDLAAWVKAELEPGERLLWAGQAIRPLTKPWSSAGQGPDVPSALIWMLGLWTLAAVAGFAARGRFGWLSDKAEAYVIMASLTLATMGAMLAASLAVNVVRSGFGAILRRGAKSFSIYALTDRRAVVWVPQSRGAFQVIHQPARSLGGVHRIELPDGTGDVIFQSRQDFWFPDGLKGISNVRRVEGLVRSVLVDPDFHKRRPVEDES